MRLIHLASLERVLCEQAQDHAVYDGSDLLHRAPANPTALIPVLDPDARIEPVAMQCNRRLGLED